MEIFSLVILPRELGEYRVGEDGKREVGRI